MKHACLLFALLALVAARPHQHPLPRAGKDFALFIAVEDYQHWGKLKHPVGEVEKLAAELHRNYGFDTLVLRNPTQAEIVTALRRYNAAAGQYPSDGQLLVYLSGHGDFDELTREGFFIPRDGKRDDAAQTTYLPFSRLQRIVENNPCRHILLAVDACYSGTFDRLVALKGDEVITFGRPSPPGGERERFIERELTLQSRYFVASGKKEQTPDASNFAAYFLRALRNGGRDHQVLTMHELVAELKKAQPKPHVATFSGHQDEANFLFVKNTAAPPPPENRHDARRDRADWQEAEGLGTAAGYRDYLRKQPRGDFRTLAEERAQKLEAEEREIAAWEAAKRANTCEGYQTFRRDYPRSAYVALAEENEKTLCGTPAPEHMVLVRGGTFEMGDQFGDGDSDEKPVHTVTLSDFYMGETEVTLREFRAFVKATGYKTNAEKSGNGLLVIKNGSLEQKWRVNWRHDEEGKPRTADNHPVNISWNDAVAYCNWLSTQQNLRQVYTISGDNVTADWSADGYRLPTEAEWEYAARSGGKREKFAGFSEESNLYRYVNFCDKNCVFSWKTEGQDDGYKYSAPVGSFQPNGLGLYDMTGNVWEWCWDWYGSDYYGKSERDNPRGPGSGSTRVLRGGSWYGVPSGARAAIRMRDDPFYCFSGSYNIGFRLARSARGG